MLRASGAPLVSLAAVAVLAVVVLAGLAGRRRAARRRATAEAFQGWTQYRPACSGEWLADRRGKCQGLTTGDMPSIEENLPISWKPCCGSLGVPPPVFQ